MSCINHFTAPTILQWADCYLLGFLDNVRKEHYFPLLPYNLSNIRSETKDMNMKIK
jgi:hypothetical protein